MNNHDDNVEHLNHYRDEVVDIVASCSWFICIECSKLGKLPISLTKPWSEWCRSLTLRSITKSQLAAPAPASESKTKVRLLRQFHPDTTLKHTLLCTQLNQAIKSEMELDYSIYLPFELANNKTKSLIDKIASYNSYTDKIMA